MPLLTSDGVSSLLVKQVKAAMKMPLLEKMMQVGISSYIHGPCCYWEALEMHEDWRVVHGVGLCLSMAAKTLLSADLCVNMKGNNSRAITKLCKHIQ